MANDCRSPSQVVRKLYSFLVWLARKVSCLFNHGLVIMYIEITVAKFIIIPTTNVSNQTQAHTQKMYEMFLKNCISAFLALNFVLFCCKLSRNSQMKMFLLIYSQFNIQETTFDSRWVWYILLKILCRFLRLELDEIRSDFIPHIVYWIQLEELHKSDDILFFRTNYM